MPMDERERARLRRLVKAHVAAENDHDIDRIMSAFAPHAIGQTNGVVSTTLEAIRQEHVQFGLSHEPGVLRDLQVVHEVEHFSDEEIIYEGHFIGVHAGTAPDFPAPSGREIKLPYVIVYRFDRDDLLVSKSARVELSPLFSGEMTP